MYLPLISLYNWDNSLLAPIGQNIDASFNTKYLQDYILNRYGDYGVINPDLDYLKKAIENWCTINTTKWKNWFSTTQYDYNPIHNYDRNETIKETIDDTGNTSASNTINDTINGTSTNTGKTSTSKAGFNATTESTMQVTDKVDANSSVTTTGTNKKTDITTATNKRTNTRNLITNISGNIGVTTTQQMIEAERKVLNFNLYTIIADEFRDEFLDCCVG